MNLQESDRSFFVGEWLVTPTLNRVQRNGDLIDVQPRLMAVLEELARAPGVVVTRDDLHRSIWRDVNVSEHALNRCIAQLRRILGDDPRSPRFIETISKRGYRLIAAVTRRGEVDARGPIDVELVILRAGLLGYLATLYFRGAPPSDVRRGLVIVNGHGVMIENSLEADALTLRTRSYWAGMPLWLTPLALIISSLLFYGHELNAGTAVALVLLITVAACLFGLAIRATALAKARGAMRTFASRR